MNLVLCCVLGLLVVAFLLVIANFIIGKMINSDKYDGNFL